MENLDWTRISEMFAHARQLVGESRIAYLTEHCGNNQELFRQVLSLLELADKPGPLDSDRTVSVLSVPEVIAGRFRIIRYIAAGGMGTVYEAKDLTLNDRLALKTILPEIVSNPKAVERFKREILVGKKITHPNVCRIYDLGVDHTHTGQEFLFLTMQYLDGETLASRIKRGPLPESEALPLIEDMADALVAAHEADVIHRDFKSGNVMLVPGPTRTRAVVTDFGLARGMHDNDAHTHTGMAGTVEYMAPEQIRGEELSPAADIYALGVVMYEMVTGRRPFVAQSKVTIVMQQLHDQPQPPRALVPHLDRNLNDLILCCLRKHPADRFQSANQMKAALTRVATDPDARVPLPKVSIVKRIGRRKLLAGLGALLCIALLTIGYIIVKRLWSKPITSVAVLPLVNRDNNPAINYLSDGVTQAITNDMSQISGLQVPAYSIVRRIITPTEDPQTAGRKLAVTSVVSGSVATEGNDLILQIELIDVNTGSQIWGRSYDRKLSDLTSLQEDVTRELAYRLRIGLADDLSKRLRRQYATNPQAYDAYLRGKYALSQRTASGFASAISYFEQAIEQDPKYAPAYAELANCYCVMAYNEYPSARTLLDKASSSADRALQLDSTLGDAYSSLAAARTLGEFDWVTAEEDYRRSIELNPRYHPAHIWYGLTLLTPLSRFAEAQVQLDQARRLDPGGLMTHSSLAVAAYYAGQYDTSLHEVEVLRRDFPSYENVHELLAEAYLAKGNPAAAVEYLRKIVPVSDHVRNIRSVMLGIAYAKTGQIQAAHSELAAAEAATQRDKLLYYHLAALCAALGDRQRALDYLEQAYLNRQTSILFVKVDPLMDPLRSEPRFVQLLAKLHLDRNDQR